MKVLEVVDLLLPEIVDNLKLKPLERGETVRFKILQKPVLRRNTADDELIVYPASKNIPKTDILYLLDKEGIHREFEVESPMFVQFLGEASGEIVIKSTDTHLIPLLYFLRMSNYNLSNQYRNTSKSPIFEELSIAEVTKNNLREEKEINALVNFILDKKSAEVNAFYKQLRLVGEETDEDKRLALIRMVKGSPMSRETFKSVVTNKSSVVREVINKARNTEILMFNEHTKVFSNAVKKDNLTIELNPIFTVPLGQEPVDALTAYFLTDTQGKSQYERLELAVEKLNKAVV